MNKKQYSISAIVTISICIGLLVLDIIAILMSYNQYISVQTDINAVMELLNTVETDIAEYNNSNVVSETEVAGQLRSASTTGTTVATLQNKYKTYSIIQDEQYVVDNGEAIGRYLSDKSKQVAWYPVDNSIVNYEWMFNTTYGFKDESIPVLWTCRETSGEHRLLAYTKAVYSATDDMFSHIECHITGIGAEYINSQVTEPVGTPNSSDADIDVTTEVALTDVENESITNSTSVSYTDIASVINSVVMHSIEANESVDIDINADAVRGYLATDMNVSIHPMGEINAIYTIVMYDDADTELLIMLVDNNYNVYVDNHMIMDDVLSKLVHDAVERR